MAEAECRRIGVQRNCDLQVVLADTGELGANAFIATDRSGQPAIIVTFPLLTEMKNEHEMAFVLSHEAAHQIEGHIEFTRKAAAELGAEMGARRFSPQLELRADALGTRIAARAGYDPVKGSEFFLRIPDPGDEFWATHPPNAQRKRLVNEVAASLQDPL